MCIAISCPAGNKLPSPKCLKTCFDNNPDGAGFAFNHNGLVEIRKGFMKFEEFMNALTECNKLYDFKMCGVLIHFRIQTHGGVNKECCHPFPLSSDKSKLQAEKIVCKYGVIHNGVISLTKTEARQSDKMSDTMLFIKEYLTKLSTNKNWFHNPQNFKLIYQMINSKMAILSGTGEIHMTEGFIKAKDGNYYSNEYYNKPRPAKTTCYTYNSSYTSANYTYGSQATRNTTPSNADQKKSTSVTTESDGALSVIYKNNDSTFIVPTETKLNVPPAVCVHLGEKKVIHKPLFKENNKVLLMHFFNTPCFQEEDGSIYTVHKQKHIFWGSDGIIYFVGGLTCSCTKITGEDKLYIVSKLIPLGCGVPKTMSGEDIEFKPEYYTRV